MIRLKSIFAKVSYKTYIAFYQHFILHYDTMKMFGYYSILVVDYIYLLWVKAV